MDHDTRAAQREADSEHAVSQEPCMRRSGCCKDESAVTVLDSVYRAFLDTNKNRNQRWTLEDLFKLTRSRGFHYEHLSIPYYAEVLVKERAEGCFIEVKLVNDGYQYSASNGEFITRHNSGTWVQWRKPRWAEACPNLARVANHFEATRFFYNHQACRVDVIMYPHDADDMGFAVTFEPGRPDYTVRQPFD
jgi:hypothetical protein